MFHINVRKQCMFIYVYSFVFSFCPFATSNNICICAERERENATWRARAISTHIMNQCWSANWPLECTTTAWWREKERIKKSKRSLSPREYLPFSILWMTTTERRERTTHRSLDHFSSCSCILPISKKIGWCMYVYCPYTIAMFLPYRKETFTWQTRRRLSSIHIERKTEGGTNKKNALLTCPVHHQFPLFLNLFIRLIFF